MYVRADFARNLERQRDKLSEMLEAEHLANDRIRKELEIVKAQRDELLAALSALVDLPDDRPIDSFSEKELQAWEDAIAAVKSVKGT